MKSRNLYYLSGAAAIALMLYFAGLTPVRLIDLRSFGMLLFSIIISQAWQPAGKLFTAVKSAITGAIPENESSAELISCVHQLENCTLISSFALLFYGVVSLMAKLSEPSTIGPNCFLALTCSIYAIAFSKLVLMPLRLRLVSYSQAWTEKLSEELLSSIALLGFPIANYAVIIMALFSLK
ncbi:MAG: hypothetical protein KKB51_00335 [Candidatus Riflebacteria bacterium]|nr:hypothetical protein [Candidatus Riflebacteria bacterium]